MKRDFFANASHELKSPLTTILGYQQMVSEAMLTKPEEIDDAVKRTIKEAKRMDKILGEMLELSRLESKYEVVIEDINLKNVVEDIIDSYNIELNEKKINVIVNVENCLVRINQSHCNQLINNLIDNAIKYNNPGGKLEITLKDNYLIIKDSGIGIAKADQIRIFERFYRVDKGRSKELGGTGLGLAIVKHICSLYSIIINLKSELYKGTEFKLTFPKNK
jgi:two-component system phosphate regulon sensor histidine kinase PhoR